MILYDMYYLTCINKKLRGELCYQYEPGESCDGLKHNWKFQQTHFHLTLLTPNHHDISI